LLELVSDSSELSDSEAFLFLDSDFLVAAEFFASVSFSFFSFLGFSFSAVFLLDFAFPLVDST